MKDKLLPVASALSLLLCVAVLLLWVRSYFAMDAIWYHPPNYVNELLTSKGKLESYRHHFRGGSRFVSQAKFGHRSQPPFHIGPVSPPAPGSWYILGFGYAHVVDRFGDIVFIVVPFWAIVLPLAVVAILSIRSWWRGRRLNRRGRCPGCGYDLRASPDRCPECGTPVQKAEAIA